MDEILSPDNSVIHASFFKQFPGLASVLWLQMIHDRYSCFRKYISIWKKYALSPSGIMPSFRPVSWSPVATIILQRLYSGILEKGSCADIRMPHRTDQLPEGSPAWPMRSALFTRIFRKAGKWSTIWFIFLNIPEIDCKGGYVSWHTTKMFSKKANRKARKIWIVFAVLLSANYGSDV